MEILPDEISAIAVQGFYKLPPFRFAFAARDNSPHLVFGRRIEKHAQGTWPIFKKVLRSPSNEDTVSRARNLQNDAPRRAISSV